MFLTSSCSARTQTKQKVVHNAVYVDIYIRYTVFRCLSFDKQLFSTYSLSIGQFSFFLFIIGIRFVFKLAMKRNDIFPSITYTFWVKKKTQAFRVGMCLAYTSSSREHTLYIA